MSTRETTGHQHGRGAGGRWLRGKSGNPAGRPKGARHKATLAAQALLDGEAEALSRKVIELAMSGDATALKICLERILPPRKDRPIAFELPQIGSAEDLPKATGAIVHAVANGDLTPQEGQAIAGILEQHRRSLEIADIETRLARLEQVSDQSR
jgi:Family of unknown function (DUF5681)